MKKFALVGAAGFIAPRHMKAIKDTGNELVAALDKNDSVGVIDSYFPEAHFFTEFERFDRHLEKRRRGSGEKVDYVSICSPNYLHDAHIRFALRIDADAICEKPITLNPWNVDALEQIVEETGRQVHTILQLRLHPAIVALQEQINAAPADKKHDIDLTYITPRGRWYMASWKGSVEKSGGVATNIGVHFFDMLQWIFGEVQYNIVHLDEPAKAAGFLELKRPGSDGSCRSTGEICPSIRRRRPARFAPSPWTVRRSSSAAGSRTCTRGATRGSLRGGDSVSPRPKQRSRPSPTSAAARPSGSGATSIRSSRSICSAGPWFPTGNSRDRQDDIACEPQGESIR